MIRKNNISLLILVGAGLISSEGKGEMHFNPAALRLGPGSPTIEDLSMFERGAQSPGRYRVDIYVNNAFQGTRDVEFVTDNDRLAPVLTVGYWRTLGVKENAFPAVLKENAVVSDPGLYISGASARLDINQLRLDLSVPQAALDFRARDAVDPALWDNGVPAFLLNYGINSNNVWQEDTTNNHLFLRLDSGLNLGAWRLRNNATYTRNVSQYTENSEESGRRVRRSDGDGWNSLNTFLQRDIPSLTGRLTLGQSSTPGDLFDSVQFQGIQLASDDSMLPDSLRGFAPVVRGIARSNAQVTVRQNGQVIYQTAVAPGNFEIRDLYPTANSGNLDVTIREEDGSENTFIQPFSAVPGMQRDGSWRYAFTAGRYRSWGDNIREPDFAQGTLQYGLSNSTTMYGGSIFSADYTSGLLGIGQGLGNLGSVSFDVTHARTQFDSTLTRTGESYRLQYAKDVMQSGTSLVLGGYRYSGTGFYSFNEANEALPRAAGDDDTLEFWRRTHNKRSRLQAQVTQSLEQYGSLSLSAYQQDYYNDSGTERTLQLGYGITLQGASYTLSLSDTRSPISDNNRQIFFSVSVPLERWLAGSRVSYSMSADNRSRIRNDVGLSGTMLDNRLSWSAREGYASRGEGNSGGVSSSYSGTYGRASAGYSYNTDSQQLNAGLNGGIVVHPWGVTLSQPLGDTMVLVRVPDGAGIDVKNQRGVRTDWRGYTVVPYVSAYRRNNVALRTESLPDEVELEEPVQTVIPTRGALVVADYQANVGARVLATVSYRGKPVPFGASASLRIQEKNVSHSFVGDNGDIYLSGVPERSQLHVQWGKSPEQQCTGEVKLSPAQKGERFRTAQIDCR